MRKQTKVVRKKPKCILETKKAKFVKPNLTTISYDINELWDRFSNMSLQNHWLFSILGKCGLIKTKDNKISIDKEYIVAGGAVRKWLFGEDAGDSDVDIYTKNKFSADKLMESIRSLGYQLTLTTANSYNFDIGGIRLSIINNPVFSYKDVSSLLNNFDLTISQFAVHDSTLFMSNWAWIDSLKKNLVLHATNYPTECMTRLMKFHSKGYKVKKETIKRLLTICKDHPESLDSILGYMG